VRKSRFTEEQIVMAWRQAEAGTPVVEVCRKLQVTEPKPLRKTMPGPQHRLHCHHK